MANTIVQSSVVGIVRARNAELINFSVLFVALATALPLIAHQFNLAGSIFLPMHVFVLTAGLLFGWRVGLIVGLLTPLISFATSGMPLMAVLPQIMIELVAYGFIAGVAREHFKFSILTSLALAMVVGRIGLVVASWIFSTAVFGSFSAGLSAIAIGLPGILLQIVLVPILVLQARKYLTKRVNHFQ